MASASPVTVVPRQWVIRWAEARDRWYPYVGAAIGAIPPFLVGFKFPDPSAFLLGSTVTFGAIISGFVGVSLSVVVGLDSSFMRKIWKSRYRHDLRNYIRTALLSGLSLSLIGLGGLLFSLHATWFVALWSALLLFCLLNIFRLAHIMLYLRGASD